MNVAHSSYTVAMKRVEQLTASYQETLIQRNAPSPDLDRMETLRTAIIQLEELIKQGDISLQREREETQQKSNMMQGDVDRIKEQMAAIDKQIMDLEMSIVAEARIIATTLSKIYMNKNLRERRFDVVILDEVSMAPLPAVYIATSHADDSVVAIGDPHQLAPIVTAVTHNAQKWLGTDLFALNGVTLERAIEGLGNSTLLKQQSRMHPDISVISRKHVYRGQITDRRGDDLGAYAKVTPLPGKPLLLCDTSDVNPIATQLDHGRINVYHALCTIAIARQALASLPKADAQGGATPRIGLVTPYRKQAELLQYLIQDAGLKDLVRAGTVHRFQGLEFEVVIFDTVESRPCSPIEYTNGVWGSKAMRLVNVAVTRPKHKLIIVANADYIQKRFARDSTLSLALREAKGADSIQSHEVIGITLPPLSETLRYLLQLQGSR